MASNYSSTDDLSAAEHYESIGDVYDEIDYTGIEASKNAKSTLLHAARSRPVMPLPKLVEDKCSTNKLVWPSLQSDEDQASSSPLYNIASTENQSSSPLYYSTSATNTTTTGTTTGTIAFANNGDRDQVVEDATSAPEVSRMPDHLTLSCHRRNVILVSLLLAAVVVVLCTLITLYLTSNSATKDQMAVTAFQFKNTPTSKTKFQPTSRSQQPQRKGNLNNLVIVDEAGEIYIDGVLVLSKLTVSKVDTFDFSETNRCIAARVSSYIQNVGLMLQTSTGIVTDKTWKCLRRDKEFATTAWAQPDFNDRSWPNAVELYTNGGWRNVLLLKKDAFPPERKWIGISAVNSSNLGLLPNYIQMYCRKVIKQ